MKKAIPLLAVVLLTYCSTQKPITGEITAVSLDTVTVQGQLFKIYGDTPRVGQKVTFYPTVRRNKMNSKRVH